VCDYTVAQPFLALRPVERSEVVRSVSTRVLNRFADFAKSTPIPQKANGAAKATPSEIGPYFDFYLTLASGCR
jgi:hypothetical protein